MIMKVVVSIYKAFLIVLFIVSMNGCAILTEIVGEKPTLSSFHGSYSVAFAIATVFGGLTHTLNWSSLSVFSICAVLSFCCTAMSSFHVYDWNQEIQITSLHTIAVGKRKIESHDDNLSDDLFSGKRDQYSASYNHSQRDVVHSDSDTDEACHSRLPFGSEHVYDEEEDYEASEANSAVAPSASGARASASPHSNQDSPPAHSRSSTQRTAESSASAGSSAQASTESVDSDFGPFAGQDPESDSLSQPLIQRKHDEDDSVQEPFSLYNAIFLSPLFAFSVIGFMGSFGEIAMVSWSIIFYLRYFDCSHFAASFGLSTFMVFMALGRFSGDYCRLLIGRRKLVRVGGVCSVMGVVLIVVSPVISQSIVPGFLIGCVGAAFTGCGLSFLIPTMFSSAGHLPKVHAGTAIATVATFTYSGAIVAPIFVGGFSQLLHSLQDAYILVTVVLSGIFVFSYVIADEIVGNKKDIIEYDAIQDKY